MIHDYSTDCLAHEIFNFACINIKTCSGAHKPLLQWVPFIPGDHQYNLMSSIQAGV